jgi:hypothetical protein
MSGGWAGTDGLAEDLARQRALLEERCPSYARALALLPQLLGGPVGQRIWAAWARRRFHAFFDRPLLLLAALRADALAEGPGHPLHAAFAARTPDVEAVTLPALAASLGRDRQHVFGLLAQRTVQTNETARAVAWLWPAALAGASGGARPVALADVGASAGLNLVADALPAPWRLPGGAPLEVAQGVRTVARLGLDRSPLDPASPDDAAWLRACVWPGELGRLDRLEAALAAFATARALPGAPVLVPAEARSIPARLGVLSASASGVLVIAYQTVVRDYLEPSERAEYQAGMRAWLAAQPPGLALWVELEPATDGGVRDRSSTLTAHVRAPRGELRTLALARCGYHPQLLHPEEGGAEELARLLRSGSATAGART